MSERFNKSLNNVLDASRNILAGNTDFPDVQADCIEVLGGINSVPRLPERERERVPEFDENPFWTPTLSPALTAGTDMLEGDRHRGVVQETLKKNGYLINILLIHIHWFSLHTPSAGSSPPRCPYVSILHRDGSAVLKYMFYDFVGVHMTADEKITVDLLFSKLGELLDTGNEEANEELFYIQTCQ